MKKSLLSLAFAVVVCTAGAQVLKNDVLNGYNINDVLEKNEYKSTKASIVKDKWSLAAGVKPPEGSESPTVGNALTYEGYKEGGLSVNLGFPEGIKGMRPSTYSITESGTDYASGSYYLACLVNLSELNTKTYSELLAFSANHTGGTSRGQFHIAGNGKGKIKVAVALGKERNSSSVLLDLDQTHLVVLKIDYDNQEASLFINPELTADEPKATVKVDTGEVFKGGIKAITVKNRDVYKGNIGSFRFAGTWADALTVN